MKVCHFDIFFIVFYSILFSYLKVTIKMMMRFATVINTFTGIEHKCLSIYWKYEIKLKVIMTDMT